MIWLRIAAVNGFLAVTAGAFGAHALKARLTPELLANFETAARYQMYHALALAALFVLGARGASRAVEVAGWGFTLGIVLFCGSLYAYSLGGPKGLVMVTPIGGATLLVGWFALLIAACTGKSA
ncbi:MAG: DUF423 domain-containing protein [Phycisphaerales bacterium]|nr:DUF423 domain-containing protein [Phycisphaerales bacterium]